MNNEPAEIPAQQGEGPASAATQLSILLSSATGMVDEEFRRSERLDAKSRNQVTITAGFFAVVQAVVVGLLNGALGKTMYHGASTFVPWLALTGGLAAIAVVVAVGVSYRAWRLRDDLTLGTETLHDYLSAARAGNPAVGVKLVEAYANIAEDRRKKNNTRADAVDSAAKACGAAIVLIGVELVLAFVAVGVQ